MVRNYKGCTGLKTGSTSQALYNLSASASRDGMNLIAVVMKAPTSALRFSNCSKLLDYGFANFEFKSLINKDDIVKSVKVNKGLSSTINAISKDTLGTLLAKGSDFNIEQNIILNEELSAPISKGQEIGKISYTLNGEVISEGALISDSDIPKINIFTMNEKVIGKWYSLMRE